MSRVRIRPKWLSNCSGAELQQMNRLRLKGESMMLEDVLQCYTDHRKSIRIFLARHEDKIVGWACAFIPASYDYATIPNNTKNPPIYTYVSRAYRGLGVGNRMLRRASNFVIRQNRRYRPTVFFWDEKSSAFFSKAQESIPKLEIYDVDEWWDVYDC